MRVLVTGASGWIGSAVVPELVGAGHVVTGLARSDASAAAVEARGATVVRGSVEDLDVLREAAAAADAVVHLAFRHDIAFAGRFADAVASDAAAIEALGAGLPPGGSIAVAGGILGLARDGANPATERDSPAPGSVSDHRQPGPSAALALAERGQRASVVRLSPTVHGEGDAGFMATLVEIARKHGFSGYPGDGSSRWTAVHVRDAARLFRLAIEVAPAGSVLHAVADEAIPVRQIAEAIGRHLDVPARSLPAEEVDEHFGFLATFLDLDGPASSALTRELTGWTPREPGLLADLDQGHYFAPGAGGKWG
ncbi:SDR family oxidoreductase [Pseudonocardia cypriaca]|uniref:Nucleoside-diphosphate-sugar epimerase n=1 Tax=Pseudonocardia cypriaca TaxID=882449 RepID=A0A543GCB9_9PSEU|nr:SDR family oxidoreductase [Pseudonocardia cypriaca]TQM43729.1 nucleoside-diphosphate-sugar epimerase [Pseudonocardia cypriaca]